MAEDQTTPEYLDRLREMEAASSPTLKLRQEIDLAAPGGTTSKDGSPQEVSVDAVKDALRGSGSVPVDVTGQKSAEAAQGMPEPTKPGAIPGGGVKSSSEEVRNRVTEALNEPMSRRILNYSLKTATGMDLDQLHAAIVEGTLPEKIGRATMSAAGAPAKVVEDVARETAQRSGLSPDVAEKIAAAAGTLAGFLSPPPGRKAQAAAKGAAVVAGEAAKAIGIPADLKAIMVDEAGALFPRGKRRLVRVESVTPAQAKAIASGEGIAVPGKHIKVDWSKVDTSGELTDILNRVAEVGREHWIDLKRGVITDPQLAELAKREGIDLVDLLSRKPGEVLNAQQQLAAFMAAGDLANQVKGLREALKVAGPEEVGGLEAKLKHLAEIMMAMVNQTRASASEQGRGLRVSGIQIPGLQEARRTTDLLELMGSGRGISGMSGREIAEATEGLDSPAQMWTWLTWMRAGLGAIAGAGFGEEIGDAAGGTTGAVAGAVAGGLFGAAAGINPKIILEAWINGLLSGPPTYIVNVVSEGANTINGLVERAIAARHGSAGAAEAVVPGEALTGLHALASWMMDSLRTYGHVLASEPGRMAIRAGVGAAAGAAISGEDTIGQNALIGAAMGAGLSGKVFLRPDELMRRREMSAEALGLTGAMGRFADVVGAAIRLPSRALVQADDWIKAGNVQAEVWMQAHRHAILEGMKPGTQEYEDFLIHARAHPTAKVYDAAQDYARYIAFQADTNAAITGMRDMNPLLRFIAPFVMTPYNIAAWAFERMPYINRIGGQMRADLAAGGVPAQLARAKTDMGIAMTGLAWYLSAAGFMTGMGPMKKEYRDMREAQQRPANSFLVPGTGAQVSYNRMDPWSLFFGTVASIQEMSHEMTEFQIMQLLGASIIAFDAEFLGKTFVAGPAQLIEAFDEAKRTGNFKPFQRYLQQQAGTLVPTGIARLSQAMDPAKTELFSALDAVRSRTRGFSDSEDLPGRHDVFNQPMTYPHVGIEILDLVNPWYIQYETADEKIRFIAKTLEKDKVAITGPRNTIGGAEESSALTPDPRLDPGVRLNPKQENQMIATFNKVQIGGQVWKDALYDLLKSEDYRAAGPRGKDILAKRLTSGYRKLAESEFLDRHPGVAAKVEEAKEKRAELTMPGSTNRTPAQIIEQLTGGVGR